MENILKGIKAFVFDVDGVFTDGGVLATSEGELYRTFDAKDGFAIRMASMRGYKLGVITGGRSESIPKRFLQCGIKPEDVYLGSRDKIEDFEDFCRKYDLLPELHPEPSQQCVHRCRLLRIMLLQPGRSSGHPVHRPAEQWINLEHC